MTPGPPQKPPSLLAPNALLYRSIPLPWNRRKAFYAVKAYLVMGFRRFLSGTWMPCCILSEPGKTP